MVLYFLELNTLKLETLSAGRAGPWVHNFCFAFLHFENISRAGLYKCFPKFVMLEVFRKTDRWHKAIEDGGNWWPLSMSFSNTLFSIYNKVDLLIFAKFS